MHENYKLKEIQSLEQNHVEVVKSDLTRPKYFVTFPYPYMNGKLHLGHLFTLSKAEFIARWQSLKGYNVLFPLSFHCTGMPISASAIKLKEELDSVSYHKIKAVSESDKEMLKESIDKLKISVGAEDFIGSYKNVQIGKNNICEADKKIKFEFNENISQKSNVVEEINKSNSLKNNKINNNLEADVPLINKKEMKLESTTNSFESKDEYFKESPEDRIFSGLLSKSSTVTSILSSLGIKHESIYKFTDPQTWINTFPMLCVKTLTDFHSMIDFSKSFITTEANFYYDSFVRWQFNRLKEKCVISFGKRYTIYDPVTLQPCLDHDRSEGEGVLPIAIDLVRVRKSLGDEYINLCLRNGKQKGIYIVFKYLDEYFVVDDRCYNNLKYQVKYLNEVATIELYADKNNDGSLLSDSMKDLNDTKEPGLNFYEKEVKIKEILELFLKERPNFTEIKANEVKILNETNKEDMTLNITDNILRYYEPESFVKARSNGICVVSLTDQWFLNYDDVELKKKAKRCIENMISLTEDTRNNLNNAVDWIGKWGFSRSFGLGTKIPFDEQYLIDSLSDSTIYMILYTFNDLLFKDFYGELEIIPKIYINEEFWDYIILGKQISIDTSLLKEVNIMRERFQYFYPVDLRVSGKDLTKNHLVFFIMTHCALFPEKYWPKRIYTNGHLMLNSEKMSKSTGNFMTADQCLTLYGASATRMCLAMCGDANEDANFLEENARSFVGRIYSLLEIIDKYYTKKKKLISNTQNEKSIFDNFEVEHVEIKSSCDFSFIQNYFYEAIVNNLNNSINSYEKMQFRDVMKFAFYEMINVREMFLNIGGSEECKINEMWISTIITLLYPIIPSFCNGLSKKYPEIKKIKLEKNDNELKYLRYIEWMKKIIKNIKFKSKKVHSPIKKIVIGINDEYSIVKQKLMKCEGNVCEIKEIVKEYDKKNKNILTSFAMDYWNKKENYLHVEEEIVLNTCKEYLKRNLGACIEIIKHEEGEPLSPIIKIITDK